MEFTGSNKKQKIIKEYSELLNEYSLILKSDIDKQINLDKSDFYKTIDDRLNVIEKYENVEIKYKYYDNDNIYNMILEPNISFNNLKILIPNPNNLHVNEIIKSFEISNGGCVIYNLCDDIDTHINVLKFFTNTSCIYNNQTKYIELSIGLIHDKILISKFEWWEIYFKLKLKQENIINQKDVIFYADMYKIKEFDCHELNDDDNYIKFLKTEINCNNNLLTDRNQVLYFNSAVSVLYLSDINPNVVKSISLMFNNICVLDFLKEDLMNTNKYKYGINSDKIIIIFNPEILNTNDNTINFTMIKSCFVQINTIDSQTRQYTVNVLNTNIYCINKNCVSKNYYLN
jgi:hypothetical protein